MKSELQSIPGVGKNMEAHLNGLGFYTLADLQGPTRRRCTGGMLYCTAVRWTAACSMSIGWR